jgi:hypothetical protein
VHTPAPNTAMSRVATNPLAAGAAECTEICQRADPAGRGWGEGLDCMGMNQSDTSERWFRETPDTTPERGSSQGFKLRWGRIPGLTAASHRRHLIAGRGEAGT